MYGGIGVACKASKFISFIIALINVCVAPKFVFKIFHLYVDDSLLERAGVFEFFLEMAVDMYMFVVTGHLYRPFPHHSLVGSELRLKTVLRPAPPPTFLGAGLSILVFL